MLGDRDCGCCSGRAAADAPSTPRRTTAEVIAAAGPGDWRAPDPANTLYLQLATGRVVIELAPAFAPQHADNIKHAGAGRILRRPGHHPLAGQLRRAVGRRGRQAAARVGQVEACRRSSRLRRACRCRSRRLPDRDGYAPEVGFSQGFPAARDPRTGEAWLAHCYGMVGAGRANEVDSGNGAELYVVTGHAPRQLDRNIALVGRVVQGIELLSVLPARHGRARVLREARASTCRSRRCAWPPTCRRPSARTSRSCAPTRRALRALVEARRNRQDDWYMVPAGHIDSATCRLVVRSRS